MAQIGEQTGKPRWVGEPQVAPAFVPAPVREPVSVPAEPVLVPSR